MKNNNLDKEYVPKHAKSKGIRYVNLNDDDNALEYLDEILNKRKNYKDYEDIDIDDDNKEDNKDKEIDNDKENDVEEFDDNTNELFFDKDLSKDMFDKDRKSIGWFSTLFIIFFVSMFGFSLYKVIKWEFDNKNTGSTIKDIQDNVNIVESKDNDSTELVNEDDDKESLYWYYVKFPLIDVDISKLKNDNKDTVGWINVNNTNINYPFVQYSDNDYYLNHSFDKSYNKAGWIFLDYRNNKDFNNRNSIIYGHSRLDKSMFGSLSKVLKKEWYNNRDNHIIRVSIDKENTLWQIFSVYKIKTESYYITTDFNNDNEYLEFLNKVKSRSIYDFNTKIDSNDKILTLSTCYSDTERTVVHAKLIKRSIK